MMEENSCTTSPSRYAAKKRRVSSDAINTERKRYESTSSDTDDIHSTESCGEVQVSVWTLQRAEMYGLCYSQESSEIFKFYELCTKNNSIFKYPLTHDRQKILDSLVSQVGKIDRPGITWKEGEQWKTWSRVRSVLEKCEKTLKSIDNELNCPRQNSKLLLLSQSAMRSFYMFLREFLIQSNRDFANEKSIPKQTYSALCCKFLEIFLLNVRSGSMDTSSMMIKGVRNLNVPDLRISTPVSTISSFGRSASVSVIRVVEVEPHCDEQDDKDVFHITRAVNHKVLGQHAGELLLDLRTSFLADIGAMFGVLCMKTSLVFTCLKMSWKHYESIKKYGEDVTIKGMTFDVDDDGDDTDEGEEGEECKKEESEMEKEGKRKNKVKVKELEQLKAAGNQGKEDTTKDRSGTIFYTRPYNFLVKDDRKQIMEFLFWLGVQLETLEHN